MSLDIPQHIRSDVKNPFVWFKEGPSRYQVFYCLASADTRVTSRSTPLPKDSDLQPLALGLQPSLMRQWYQPSLPHLAFIPARHIWDGPIFSRFSDTIRPFSTSITTSDGRYRFCRRLAMAWLLVERTVIFLIHALGASDPPIHFPSDFAYDEAKDTVEQVVRDVVAAHRLFVLLVARLRYAMAITTRLGSYSLSQYAKEILNMGKDHLDWIRELEVSTALTTDQLVGCFLCLQDIPDVNQARYMALHGAPVYIQFAYVDVDVCSQTPDISLIITIEQALALNIVSSNQDEDSLISLVRRVPFIQVHSTAQSLPFRNTNRYSTLVARNQLGRIPDSHPRSEQPHSQWWFTKQFQANAIFHQTHLSSSHSFFVWEGTALHEQYLLRRRLRTPEALHLWSECPPSHRLFTDDSFGGTWDLFPPSCTFLDGIRGGTHRKVIAEDNRPHGTSRRLNPCLDPDHLFRSDLQTCMPTEPLPLHNVDVRQTFASRYGIMIYRPLVVSQHSADALHARSRFEAGLGCSVDQDIIDVIFCAFYCPEQHMDRLLDLTAMKWQPVPGVTVHKHKACIRYSGALPSHIPMYVYEFEEEVDVDWVVAVPYAASVVQSCRFGWLKQRSTLVQEFLRRGVTFFTLRRVPAFIAPALEYDLVIPDAFHDDRFLLQDKFAYREERERLFDSRRGRVCGMRGGLVARLWRVDELQIPARVNNVLAGPSSMALYYGVRITFGGDEYYDDDLESVIKSIACGLYRPSIGLFNMEHGPGFLSHPVWAYVTSPVDASFPFLGAQPTSWTTCILLKLFWMYRLSQSLFISGRCLEGSSPLLGLMSGMSVFALDL
ncbi:hypothetical protein CPB83DRAFT_900129 [Crepidotus variabilis]|uniref:Uncharacterized protein n=1 Tax=Crepidotus variabilis TaxID=179855 RepID=A0A9P6E3N9_9AGAR|nr:hypothetical protein CPB83DRAFT_900129 [Crepidotus variabilis]